MKYKPDSTMEGHIALCFPLFPPVSWKKCRIETVPKRNALSLNMAVVQISRETEGVVHRNTL